MIRFRLKELMADKGFEENRRVTLDEVAKATGVHRTTLSKIANQKGYNTTTDILDKLCEFFEVDVGEVAQYVGEDDQGVTGEQ
ncbi:putative transcriptional regulator [Halopseudomonas formosensis]|uniref:Putative transcriptional regulator n=1 Tax=Halopseudomonas formosensis TaxID=1002526 RepID=A0A1I6C945_9GAMM|nr:helix-turn-helix transcriptional regulator [Halopseudomonas formosensis]SFQ89689.1 putative transcriptional regulator [Halopseudomonas formosensis]